MVIVVGLTFLTVLAVILGAYALFVARPEKKSHAEVRGRLTTADPAALRRVQSVAKRERVMSQIDWLDHLLQRLNIVTHRLQRLIEQGGTQATVGTIVLATAFSALAGAVALGGVVRTWSGSAAGAIAMGGVPSVFLRYRRTKRNRALEQQFPDAIDLIARALRAGHPLTAALAMAADELAPPVSEEFRLLYERQNYGFPMNEALRSFADRVVLVDARFFVTAVLTQREAGGNLAEVLDNLAGVMRERAVVKRQLRVVSAHGRMTGWILAAMPPVMALIFMVTSPSHLATLINDPLGRLMIGGGLILQVTGTVLIRRIVNIEY